MTGDGWPEPVGRLDERREFLGTLGRLIGALRGLEIIAAAYSAELCDLERTALSGATAEEILTAKLGQFRVMLSTAIDDVQVARDETRGATLRMAFNDGLGVEQIAELLEVPPEFIESLINDLDV